jgi:hypothetical protein
VLRFKIHELLVECNVGRTRSEHLGLKDLATTTGIARSTLAGLTTLTREPVTNSANIEAICRFFQIHHPSFDPGMLFEFTPPLSDNLSPKVDDLYPRRASLRPQPRESE